MSQMVKVTLGEIKEMVKDMDDEEKIDFFYDHFPEDQAQFLTTYFVFLPFMRKEAKKR